MAFFTTFIIGAVAGGATWELFKRRDDLTMDRLKSLFQRKQAPEVAEETGEPAATTVAIVLDQLEAIRGIGPVYARRLNEAGIFTYANLAQATPDQLVSIVVTEGSVTPDVAAWISEAQTLSTAVD